MSFDVDTQKRNLRPFTRRVRATGNGNIGGTTLVSLWDPAVPEGLNEGNDYWNDGQILILSGEMANQGREITGFVQATGVITVAPRFVNPTVSLLTADSLIGDLTVDVADASIFPDSGSLLAIDAPIGSPALVVVDASKLRAGFAVISDTTGASEAIVIVDIDPATNTLVLAAPIGATYTLDDEAAVSMGAAYIWDDTPDAEAVIILGIDETLNQLTIAFPGVVANYTVVQNAAISMSPTILDDVEFVLMPPAKTVDAGALALLLLLAEPEWLFTDKDVEFTGAIAVNAKEDENLTGLAANKIVITDVMIEGEENLQFYLLFWSTDAFENADLDIDTFLGFVDLDIPTSGFQIGAANQYYLSVTDINLHYEDEDATNEIHVSLLCRTAAGKTAGAAGAVKIKIGYQVRE